MYNPLAMRYTLPASVYAAFVVTLITLATALITISWNSGCIDARYRAVESTVTGRAVDEADPADIEAALADKPWTPVRVEAQIPPEVPILDDLYPPQYPNAPLPSASAKASELVPNLFYSVMFYGHPRPEDAGRQLTHEYDRETGYGRTVGQIYEDMLIDYLSYTAALEMYAEVASEIGLFDSERQRMRALTPQLLEELPPADDVLRSNRVRPQEPYWLARRLALLTGAEGYNLFADAYAEPLLLQLDNYNNMVQNGTPNTVYPTFFAMPAIAFDMGVRQGRPELKTTASQMMNYLIDSLWDPTTQTVHVNFGSQTGPGSDTRQAVDQFNALEGLWAYADLTGDTRARQMAETMSHGFNPAAPLDVQSPFVTPEYDVYKIYATLNEQGTLAGDGQDRISGLLDLQALWAVQHLNAANGYVEPLRNEFASALTYFEGAFYDEIFNGFYMEYTRDDVAHRYQPIDRGGHFYLSPRMAIRYAYLRMYDQWERQRVAQGQPLLPGATVAAPAVATPDGTEPDVPAEPGGDDADDSAVPPGEG